MADDTTDTHRNLPADAVALTGTWGDYTHGVSAGGGRFQVVYRGGVDEIDKLTVFTQGTGVGVLEGPLTEPDGNWDFARKLICEGGDFGGMHPGNPQAFGSARCPNGEMKGASGDSVVGGKDGKELVGLLSSQLVPYYRIGIGPQGNRPVWLTAESYLAPADNNQVRATLRLINSGQEDIVLRSPEEWEGSYNPMGSGFTFVSTGGYDDLGHRVDLPDLGVADLAPGQRFPDGRLVVSAGQHRDVVFLAYPERPFSAGIYETGGGASFLHVLAPESLKGSVGIRLHHTTGNRFDHNYPADDAGLSQLEALRRQRDALLPALKVGATLTEGGWYRPMARSASGDVPRLFHTGDALPAAEVVMLTPQGPQSLGNATGWRWEAYPEAQVTGHPRERCPRSGLWLPTVPAGAPAYFSAKAQPTRMQAGQPMPTLGLPDAAMESRVVWTWIGS